MGMSVDQVVIAMTSSGGCVFITIRWKDFICITYGSSDRLKEMMDIDRIKHDLKYGCFTAAIHGPTLLAK
jgi:hypothetical protein